jgi:hypothetical protein
MGLVIVDETHVEGIDPVPPEHDAPSVVDADGMEALQVPMQEVESIARRGLEVGQILSGMEHVELAGYCAS